MINDLQETHHQSFSVKLRLSCRWCDLLVGAPFYFQRQQEAGGAVYVYMNEGGRFEQQPSLLLTGPLASGLGMALVAAGDLDQDGFQGEDAIGG